MDCDLRINEFQGLIECPCCEHILYTIIYLERRIIKCDICNEEFTLEVTVKKDLEIERNQR